MDDANPAPPPPPPLTPPPPTPPPPTEPNVTFRPETWRPVTTPTGPTSTIRPPTESNPIHRPAETTASFRRTAENEETTVLTPVTAATHILDRIPLSERKRWRLLAGGAGLLAIVGMGFSFYLWNINSKWQARAEELSTEAHSLGDRLADTRAQVIDEQTQIDLLTEQLATANARVIELADEKAQEGDAAAYAQNQIAYYAELSALGGSVSLALNRCVNSHETLVTYLKNPALDPTEVANYESSVNAMCNAAQSANTSLQQALTAQP